MLVRSPRRFAILAFIALVFIFAVLQQSPWAHEKAYERITLFDWAGRPPDQLPNTLETEDQAQLGDAWQHAVPVATPGAADAKHPTSQTVTIPPPAMVPIPEVKPTESYPPWVTAPSRTASFIPPTPRPSNMKEYMKKMLKWSRPSWDGHWPPFQEYVNKAYDPNRWEAFDMWVMIDHCHVQGKLT